MVPVWLLPALAAAADAEAAATDVETDGRPGKFDSPGIIATLTVAGASLLALSVWIAREKRSEGSVRLPVALMALQVSSVLVVAIGAWVLTYASAFNSLHENTNKLIAKSGESVHLRFRSVLMAGEQTAKAAEEMIGFYSAPRPGYPHTQRALWSAHRAFSGPSITLVYFGSVDGRYMGLGNFRDGEVVLRDAVPPSDSRLQCRSSQRSSCQHPACGNGTCQWCATVRGVVQDGPQCPSWRPAVVDLFKLASDPLRWDLPPRRPAAVGYCKPATAADGTEDVIRSTRLNGEPGRMWRFDAASCAVPFDPRVRDWFATDGEENWVVYDFATTEEYGDVLRRGLTVSRPVRHADSGELLGVVGVDFTLRSLSSFLAEARPSPGSHVFVVEGTGYVVASSLDVREVSEVAYGDDGSLHLAPRNVMSDWVWRGMFAAVMGHYGSLANATAGAPYILRSGEGYCLVETMMVGELRWLLVIYVPYSDVTGDAEDASVIALGVVVAVGLCSGFGVSALIFNVLEPLEVIVSQMALVAQLQVDGLELPPGSFARELQRLRQYYLGMVDALRYYRDFVPQSMMALAEDAVEDSLSVTRMASPVSSQLQQAGTLEILSVQSRRTSSGAARSRAPSLQSSTSSVGCLASAPSVFNVPMDHRLTHRRVSIVIANIRRWLKVVHNSSATPVAVQHSAYVGRCVEAARLHRGVADSLQGDRVAMNFNGVRVNNQHAIRAAQVGLHVSQRPQPDGPEHLEVCSGVASGKCLCGNMGATGLKTYAVVGVPASVVHVCERAATRWSLPCVLDGRAHQEVSCGIVCKLLCKVRGRKSGLLDAAIVLYEPLRENSRPSPAGEWMYQVGADPTAPFNAAAELLLGGCVAQAKDLCRKSGDSEGVPELMEVISEIESSGRALGALDFDDAGGLPAVAPLKLRVVDHEPASEFMSSPLML